MPGLRPTIPEPDPDPGDENSSVPVNFSYLTMRAQSGEVFFAMTFQQMIAFLSEVLSRLDEEDESTMHHLYQINNILRKYIGDGD